MRVVDHKKEHAAIETMEGVIVNPETGGLEHCNVIFLIIIPYFISRIAHHVTHLTHFVRIFYLLHSRSNKMMEARTV